MSEWQPIETAPRDGTPFFAGLWVEHKVNAEPPRTTWETFYVWVDEERGDFDLDCDPGWSIDDFQCWVPAPKLPAPPDQPSI